MLSFVVRNLLGTSGDLWVSGTGLGVPSVATPLDLLSLLLSPGFFSVFAMPSSRNIHRSMLMAHGYKLVKAGAGC